MPNQENSTSKPEEITGMNYVVISPVKNEAEFIEMTIESMIHQTIKPSVWVIVNDGSNDATESIVRKYTDTISPGSNSSIAQAMLSANAVRASSRLFMPGLIRWTRNMILL